MVIVIGLPLLITIAGALIYALSQNGKAIELGRGMFWIGLFFTVWGLVGANPHLRIS